MADEANGQANAMRRDTHMHTETHRQHHLHRHCDLGRCWTKVKAKDPKKSEKERKKKSNKYPAGKSEAEITEHPPPTRYVPLIWQDIGTQIKLRFMSAAMCV